MEPEIAKALDVLRLFAAAAPNPRTSAGATALRDFRHALAELYLEAIDTTDEALRDRVLAEIMNYTPREEPYL